MSSKQQIVPLADPRAENQRLRRAILEAVAGVVDRGEYVLGTCVSRFERELADSVGAAGAIGVGCGTEALVVGLLACGVGCEDEVIAPSHTAGPTIAAIRMTGAVPVFVDVRDEDFCIDPEAFAAAIGPRTKAVIPVHLYGHPADMERIVQVASAESVAIVEDCAQAQGARIGQVPIGAFGDVGCYSFYPTKNLGAVGDGGAVLTLDVRVLEKLRMLRTYGWTQPQFAELEGGRCTRLDELQAAILLVKLSQLEDAVMRRRAIAARYVEGLADLPISLPAERIGMRHAYHLFVIRSDRRDDLAARLKANGIMTGRHYPFPAHAQPALASRSRISGSLARTERIVSEILSIPIFPDMTEEQIDHVIDAMRHYFGK